MKSSANYNSEISGLDSLAKKYEVGTDAVALEICMDNLEPTYLLGGASSKEQLGQKYKSIFKLEKRN
jgi:hypothetical protein